MKSLKSITGVILVCLAVGCKKEATSISPLDKISEVSSLQDKTDESGWLSNLQWNVVHQPSYSVYHTNINIENAASPYGAVLVYKKDGESNTVATLPYEENRAGQKVYWYYEVNGNNVMLSADVYGQADQSFVADSFKYIFLNQSTVQKLEKSGLGKVQLMTLPYEKFLELNR